MTNAIEGFAGLDALIHGESLVFHNRSAVASANTARPLANAGQPAAMDPLLPTMIGLADLVYGNSDLSVIRRWHLRDKISIREIA